MLMGLFAMTLGTLYQKKFCSQMDLRSGGVIQYLACTIVLLPVAWMFETMQIDWTGEFVFALSWLILVLSVGAVGLLYTLIKRGAASKVASLFYLSPPFAALFAYFLFDETLGVLALAGMFIVAVGVILVNLPAHKER